MNVWFLSGAVPTIAEDLLAGYVRIAGWKSRVAAIGHGQRVELAAADALTIAAEAEPAGGIAHDGADPTSPSPGAPITISADDYGRDPISGVLVAANRDRVVLERHDPRLGKIHVHFPRVGYIVASAV